MNPEGGGVSAWPSADSHGAPAVAIREDFPTGAVQTALVSGGRGRDRRTRGRALDLGDGLVAFQQGPVGDAAIVAAQTNSAPAAFVTNVPRGLAASLAGARQLGTGAQRRRSAELLGGPRRAAAARPVRVDQLRIDSEGLASGVHKVQVLASEIFGGATLSHDLEPAHRRTAPHR